MITTSTGDIVLNREDSDRLSKLIEWAAQFVISTDHITVQDAAQFIRDWKARFGPAPQMTKLASRTRPQLDLVRVVTAQLTNEL